ncbi:MAG TPA: zinc ribbon domain-containing protein [Blastocatellia bacterium]|nr:zinc ribbon domain-containing protein [Blastocatellia bacterium]
MPIYEYICEKCGSHLEVMQKVSDAPLKRCTKCRGKLEKIFSRTSFQLKGGGWYQTDYSGKSSSTANKAEKSPKSEKPSAKKESTASAD